MRWYYGGVWPRTGGLYVPDRRQWAAWKACSTSVGIRPRAESSIAQARIFFVSSRRPFFPVVGLPARSERCLRPLTWVECAM